MKNKNILLILIALILLLGGLFFWWYRQSSQGGLTPYELLQNAFPGFDRGTQLIKEGKYTEATPLFEDVMTGRKLDFEKEADVKYALALSLSSLPAKNFDDLTRSISLFKEIVADPNYPEIVKAQSVLAMTQLLYSPASKKARELIASTEPYKQFSEEKGLVEFKKNLLEYGESFYAISGIEMRLAVIHARNFADLMRQKKAGGNAGVLDPQIERERLAIIEKIQTGNSGLEIFKAKSYLLVYIPDALLSKALAVQSYYQATNDMKLGDPDALFKEALASAEQYYPFHSTYVRYYHALFLAGQPNGKTENADEIKTLLAEFHGKPVTPGASYLAAIFRYEKQNIVGEKYNLVTLSEIDPEFKTFLRSLGWNDTDFTLP